jgi:lipopolysaccharide export system permease protein
VFWGRLHCMILIELFKVFFLALLALTGLILLVGIISEAMKNGFSPAQIMTAIPLLLPSLLPYTVPTTTLFATCLVYGRLSADNEIVALKAAGVHMAHVVWPAAALGLFASAATMFLYLDAIPYTSFLLKTSLADDIEEVLYASLRRDGQIRHPKVNYEIHVSSIQGRTLQDVIFKRRAADGNGFDTVARAREAELHVDMAHKQILIDMRQCQVVQNNTVGVLDDTVWPVDIPSMLLAGSIKVRACDMTWLELFDYEEELLRDRQKLSRDIDSHQKTIDRGKASPHFQKHVHDQTNERKIRDSQILNIECEWHMRAAFSLGGLCFALIGCPIGIWFSKSDYLSAFVTCFLPIVTIYYPLMFCMINLSRSGKVPPWTSIYNADVMMAFAGVILFRWLARG